MREEWHESKSVIYVLVILFFPLGIYLLWRSKTIGFWPKIMVSGLVGLVVAVYFGPYDSAGYTERAYDTGIEENLGLKQRKLTINACEVTYWISDNGKTQWVVFLHGTGADHRMFLQQAKALSYNFNLLLIDGRGQGKSRMIDENHPVVFSDMIDDVVAIMDAENIRQTNLIAQSLGASLAQEIAYYHPDRVEKMVLIGCYNHHGATGGMWKIRNFLMTTLLKVIPWNTIASKFGEMTSENKEVQQYTVECLKAAGRESWKNLGLSAYATKHQVTEYKPQHETLLLRGEHDNPGMLSAIYSGMLKVNPLAKAVVIPDSGHICNMENVPEVNRAILSFL